MILFSVILSVITVVKTFFVVSLIKVLSNRTSLFVVNSIISGLYSLELIRILKGIFPSGQTTSEVT